MERKKYDVLIVGQGVAGTCIAYQFLKGGNKVLIIDPEKMSSASLVASGIINPITGRHFVKTWKFDTLWSYLLQFYPEMEAFLGLDLFEQVKVFRSLPSAKEFNDWIIRTKDPDIHPLLSDENSIDSFTSFVKLPEYSTAISGGRVNTTNMIYGFRKLMKDCGNFLSDEFDFSQLEISPNGYSYKGIIAEKIIFCEGYKAIHNPYFSYLPFHPYKGEILMYSSEEKLPGDILKNDLFFVPVSARRMWVGTKNTHVIASEAVDEKVISALKLKAEKYLESGFTFIEAKAGIRPSVKDRRPLIGSSRDFPGMFIFNGLGSKGTSLAPYFSAHLYNHITENTPLSDEVNIVRYHF